MLKHVFETAYPLNISTITTSTTSVREEKPMNGLNKLPEDIIKKLIKVAENCVIKSTKISRDETPDFVQNCLLKLL